MGCRLILQNPRHRSEYSKDGFERFMGPKNKPKHVYTDNSPELMKAMRDMEWSAIHDTPLPYRPQTNGVAERAGKRMKEGTST
eukprot:2549959-Karenia_brevis.AAC.1